MQTYNSEFALNQPIIHQGETYTIGAVTFSESKVTYHLLHESGKWKLDVDSLEVSPVEGTPA